MPAGFHRQRQGKISSWESSREREPILEIGHKQISFGEENQSPDKTIKLESLLDAGKNLPEILLPVCILVKTLSILRITFPSPATSMVRTVASTHYPDGMSVTAQPPRRQRLAARAWIHAQRWAVRRLYSMHRIRTAPHLETGALGEREALFHLRRHGYVIVARRWKSAKFRGDLDLIAWHGATLCFIEVKTRTHRDAFAAELAVDHEKQRVLRRLARAYMQRIPASRRPPTARFDVISLYLTSENAPFSAPEFVLNQGAFEWA